MEGEPVRYIVLAGHRVKRFLVRLCVTVFENPKPKSVIFDLIVRRQEMSPFEYSLYLHLCHKHGLLVERTKKDFQPYQRVTLQELIQLLEPFNRPEDCIVSCDETLLELVGEAFPHAQKQVVAIPSSEFHKQPTFFDCKNHFAPEFAPGYCLYCRCLKIYACI